MTNGEYQKKVQNPWQVFQEIKEERKKSKICSFTGRGPADYDKPPEKTGENLKNAEIELLVKLNGNTKGYTKEKASKNDSFATDKNSYKFNKKYTQEEDHSNEGSNFPKCYNMNNKYADFTEKRYFWSPGNIKRHDGDMDFEIKFPNHYGAQRSKTKAEFSASHLSESESMASVHDMHLEDKFDVAVPSVGQMTKTDVIRKDLNTNWAPEREKLPQHTYMKNYQGYHGMLNQIPNDFVEDIGSCVDGNRCTAIDCHCRYNQWSPFLSPIGKFNGDLRGQFEISSFDDHSNRRFVTSGLYRSPPSSGSYATSEEFEVVHWDSNVDSAFHDAHSIIGPAENKTNTADNKRESFNTAPNTPELDFAHFDGWHTAPNSPAQDADVYYFVDGQNDFDLTHSSHHKDEQNGDENMQVSYECRAVASDTQFRPDQDSHHRNPKQSVSESTLNTFTKDLLAALPRSEADKDFMPDSKPEATANDEKGGATECVPIKPPLSYFDEKPIIYSADAVEYLVDSETGEAKTCGKGSFGQVYNARFSDPSLYHIPIVVKEFDEEFTNKKEILQEAQRLMFLQDTGYVPICYGMIELSTTDRRSYGIIQEFVGDGTTLEQILWERIKMPIYCWLTIALQCCDGLARFHDKGILLNDIKSNNIITIFYGNGYVCIKYIDFGLATDMRGRSYRNTKSLDEFIYLAPEVRLGHQRTNVASDIFSLGYMLQQIHHFANVKELKFVANLCMNENPHCRIPVKAAVGVIEEQLEGLEFFNDTITD